MSPAQKQKAYRERKAAAARLATASNPDTQPGQPFSVTPPADVLPATPPPADPFDLYADDDATSSPPAPARTSLPATLATPATQPPPATPAHASHASAASSTSSDQQPPPASSEATTKPSSKATTSPSSEKASKVKKKKSNTTVTGEAEGALLHDSSAAVQPHQPTPAASNNAAAGNAKQNTAGVTVVTRGGQGAGIAADEGSAVTRTRGPIVAGSPKYFDLLPLDPVPGDVFDRCCVRLARGDNWPDIAKDEGMGPRELWQRCGKYAHLNPNDAPKWEAACHAETANHRRDVATIHARALAAGFDGVRKKKRTKTGADGKTETEETEEQYADPSMIRIAQETADPATYGRGAGRQAPVTVNTTNAAFFGGTPPPGNLSGRFDD